MRKRKPVPEPPAHRETLTVAEAAAIAGLGQSTIRGLIKSGRLRSSKIGRRRLVMRTHLVDMLLAPGDQDAQAADVR